MRTRVLPGNGYIRYEVLPGDDETPGGELIVVHQDRAPAPETAPAQDEPQRTYRPARSPDHCAAERGKLVARIYQLRGIEVDPEFAQWLEHNLTVGDDGISRLQIVGEPQLLSAITTDGIARALAEDLARCERR